VNTARQDALVDQIRSCLIAEAEEALARAERYAVSTRQGERKSTRIYVQRGQTAMGGAA
jgi:hypothetical protein